MKVFLLFGSFFFLFSGLGFGDTRVSVDTSNQELVRHHTSTILVGLTYKDGNIVNRVFSQEDLFGGLSEFTIPHVDEVESCVFNWQVSTTVLSEDSSISLLYIPAKFGGIQESCLQTDNGFVVHPGDWKFHTAKLDVRQVSFQKYSAEWLFINLNPETADGDGFVPQLKYEGSLQEDRTPYLTQFKFFSKGPLIISADLTWLTNEGDIIEEALTYENGDYSMVVD